MEKIYLLEESNESENITILRAYKKREDAERAKMQLILKKYYREEEFYSEAETFEQIERVILLEGEYYITVKEIDLL